MDENQNYGYNGSVNDQQGAYGAQQPYGEQQVYENQQPYSNQQVYENQQPYSNQQVYENQQPYGNQQYTQNPYAAPQQPMGPQYTQTPYGAQQQYNQQNFGQPVKAVVYDAVPGETRGTSVAALVCGIIGLLFFWIPGLDIVLCLSGLICGIIAIAKGHGGRGMAITGLILSIIDCILTLIFFYFFALGLMLV